MRKTSQDGGDSTSVMSSVENEIRKPSAAIIKNKRSSIKRKVQTLSHESDDAVSEPLLQKEKEKEKSDPVNQSAKFSILKSKTDSIHDRDSEKDKLLPDNKAKITGLQEVPLSSSTKENIIFKSQPNTTAPLHNHMNTNVFSSIDTTKFITATKNQILVEIDGCKQTGYNPSPLIFTTAKIHTDSKTKQMEPVQVTTVPILSTTEIVKTGKASSGIDIIQSAPTTSDTKVADKCQKISAVPSINFAAGTSSKHCAPKTSEGKIENKLADRAVVGSNSMIKDSIKHSNNTADTKCSKPVLNKLEDNLSKSHDPGKLEESMKTDLLVKKVQSLQHKDVKTVNTINVSKPLTTIGDNIAGTSRKPKVDDVVNKLDEASIVKKGTLKHQEGKIDENANANSITVHHPSVLGVQKLPTESKIYTGTVSKHNISKDTISVIGNKQLPRQKNVMVEETCDTSKTKPIVSESASYSDKPKYIKDNDSAFIKSTTQSKVSERGDRELITKTLPNSSANNIINTMTTKTTAPSITSKPTITSLTSFTPAAKSTMPDSPQCSVTTGSMSASSKPVSTKISSADIKANSSMIPTTTSVSIISTPQTSSTSSLTAPVTSSSTTKSSGTGAVIQSSGPSKLSGASSVKLANVGKALLTSSLSGGPSTAPLNLSADKSTSTVSLSTSNTANPVTTTPGPKTSTTSQKNGPKTKEVNKDSKGFKT